MAVTKTAGQYDLSVTGVFDVDAIYKETKDLIGEAEYIFTEKEQEAKSNQYGEQMTFKMHGWKKFDDFSDSEMDVELYFSNCTFIKVEGKKMAKGHLRAKMKFVVRYDYKDRWRQSFFLEKLFTFYINYLGAGMVKEKYFKPVAKQSGIFYSAFKDMLDLYL
jgi:hypothetical protein